MGVEDIFACDVITGSVVPGNNELQRDRLWATREFSIVLVDLQDQTVET